MLGRVIGGLVPSVLGWGVKKIANSWFGKKLMDLTSSGIGKAFKDGAVSMIKEKLI